LQPFDSPDSVWRSNLQHRRHSQHYGTVLAWFAFKDTYALPLG
jgi:hypothetical protein